MALTDILSKGEEALVAEEREALSELRLTLERIGGEDADKQSFDASIRQLDELFLLVVAGEFNAGKSAFVNALLGSDILEMGVTPTTQRITELRYGKTLARADGVVAAPLEVLEKLTIVDTPGTNAIAREHEKMTREFIPRSDMVLFVTSADRPFTESERTFLQSIRSWGKKIVFVINKIDLLETSEDVNQVVRFVREQADSLLQEKAQIFPVSAKRALRGKTDGDATLVERSRFDALEDYIVRTLDARERVRLKLSNPLGVGRALAGKYLGVVGSELSVLKEDLDMLSDIERQLSLYEEDQSRDFAYRLSDIDNALLDFENRGAQFFEETLRLTRVFELVNKAKTKADFEKKVVGDLPQVVEKRVEAVIDWMVESELRQWKAVMEHLDQRRSAREGRVVGKLPATFEQDRKRLLDSVGRDARRAVEGYDREKESTRLADSVQSAVAGTALLEVGAVGLGTLVGLIATTTAADVTGILAAGALSVVGLLVLPAKRRRARRELNEKVAEVREQLMTSLKDQFAREMKASVSRIGEAIAPYTRFVRSERDRLGEARGSLEASAQRLDALQARIDRL